MIEIVLSEDFEKRLASLHFSAMRVTKATTFRATTSTTSHITIIGLNIVDPFRTSIAFLSEYLRHQCSIPHSEEWPSLKGWTNRMRDLLIVCLQRVESFSNSILEMKFAKSFAVCLRGRID